VPYP
jgi:hypothetical protein